MNAAEARYWLSDRHDLYLLFCFAVGCLSLIKLFDRETNDHSVRSVLGLMLILALFQWGAFLSNEKGTAAPLTQSLLALALVLRYQAKDWRRWALLGAVVALSGLMTLLYFRFRFAVLGTAVGGYTNTIFGGRTPNLTLLFDWARTVFGSFFRQRTVDHTHVATLVVGCSLALLVLWDIRVCKHRIGWGRVISILVALTAAIFAAAAPTLQFSLNGPPNAVLNGRMLFFPTVIWSIALSLLFGSVWLQVSQSLPRVLIVSCAALFLASAVFAGRTAIFDIYRAGQYVKQVRIALAANCSCIDPNHQQALGLPALPFAVNTFTEGIWAQNITQFYGTPYCSDENREQERCTLSFSVQRSGLVPVIREVSESIRTERMQPFLDSKTDAPEKLGATIRRAAIVPLEGQGRFIHITGWARFQDSQLPPDLYALSINHSPVVVTPPHVPRGQRMAAAEVNRGFAFMYPIADDFPTEPTTIEIWAFRRSSDGSTQKYQVFSRTVSPNQVGSIVRPASE